MKTDDESVRIGVDNDRPWTLTASGIKLYYLNPTAEMINLNDICHSLGNICRFTGATGQFYSVAQHSLMVGTLVKEALEKEGAPYTAEFFDQVLAALLHDAAEAYVNDIASPLKLAINGRYSEVEQGLIDCVFEHFEIDRDYYNGTVKLADNIALQVERYWLMPDHPDWPKVPEMEMVYPKPPFKDPITAAKELETSVRYCIKQRTWLGEMDDREEEIVGHGVCARREKRT